MFSFELNDHPLLLALPEEVDQGILQDTALAIAEDALEGQPDYAKVSPRALSETVVNAILAHMPDDFIEPVEPEDITSHGFKLTQPVPRDAVLEGLDGHPVAICVHAPVDVHVHMTEGFADLNVPHERMDALADNAADSAVFSDEPSSLQHHRWGEHGFVIWAGPSELDEGVHLTFALAEEWRAVFGRHDRNGKRKRRNSRSRRRRRGNS
jgi:hypothetical protein